MLYRNRKGTFEGGNFGVHVNFDGTVPGKFAQTVDKALSVASYYIEAAVIPEIHACNQRPVLVQKDRIPFREETSITGPGFFGKMMLAVNATVDTMYSSDIEDALRLTVVQAGAEVSLLFADAYAEDLETKRLRKRSERMFGPLAGLDGRGLGDLSSLFVHS